MTELVGKRADGRTAQLGFTERLLRLLALERENAQLREALSSRIAIEQAQGVLVERFDLSPDQAFELLRRAARTTRQPVQRLAAILTAARTTPPEIDVLLNRNGRSRKARAPS